MQRKVNEPLPTAALSSEIRTAEKGETFTAFTFGRNERSGSTQLTVNMVWNTPSGLGVDDVVEYCAVRPVVIILRAWAKCEPEPVYSHGACPT